MAKFCGNVIVWLAHSACLHIQVPLSRSVLRPLERNRREATMVDEIAFFPVVNLLTGPPGLLRNGGIWKTVKAELAAVSNPPRLMVQALHFTTYSLSQLAWDDWFFPNGAGKRLSAEIESVFGAHADVFVDSGGYQLLSPSLIDLSKWRLQVSRGDILKLQRSYSPSRIASLDLPLSSRLDLETAKARMRTSVKNAVWLVDQVSAGRGAPTPYLVVHGRNEAEIRWFGALLKRGLPRSFLRRADFGIALGSQVALGNSPQVIISNVQATLKWMHQEVSGSTPLHVFGVGEGLIGSVAGSRAVGRPLSFDNSTYVQAAFKQRIYDSKQKRYIPFEPAQKPACSCHSCDELESLGAAFLTELLSQPPYQPLYRGEAKITRSHVLGLIAGHNLRWWRSRARFQLTRRVSRPSGGSVPAGTARRRQDYDFPLRSYHARSPSLLLLPCAKGRPYVSSRSHRRVKSFLQRKGYSEGEDYDRVTLSGLFGPVHWKDETTPVVMGYDFVLNSTVSEAHVGTLRVRTASVLRVLRKRYGNLVAYVAPRRYREVFGPVVRSFQGRMVRALEDLPSALE